MTALLFASALSAAAIAAARLLSQQLGVGERGELVRGPVRILGREVLGRALREDPRGVGEPALVDREVAQSLTPCKTRPAASIVPDFVVRFAGQP